MQHSRIRKPGFTSLEGRSGPENGLSGASKPAPGTGSCGGSTSRSGEPGAAMSAWDHQVYVQRELLRNDIPIVVSIGLPYARGLLWYAPFRVEGVSDEPVLHAASGQDSFEAIQSAIKMIGAMVNSWNTDGAITWDGGHDLGFW
ncbi:DUF6968 family protein [Nocardia nova]|uniref:DUF6968 family protein n=1 Tax=Nocardia nova TaxID=37330 RepID=UPI0033CA17F5